LKDKPDSYFSQHGFPRLIMAYIRKEDFEGKKILDVGCSIGSFLLSVLVWRPELAIGIDVTEDHISTANECINNSQVKFLVASALALPFPNESFDTITSWEVLEHIPKHTEVQFFNEIWRVLKPGGRFYFSTPYRNFFSCIGDPAWWLRHGG
jgi:2-polyprenyl-3-methyl-5-hydroxy-6-metoxy-1,4-benzoquinol methylase